MLRQEIHGVVAGDYFKDRLLFVSLYLIKVGYKESEIVEAVIRAVSSSFNMRSYLEIYRIYCCLAYGRL